MRSLSPYTIWLSLLFLIPVYSHALAIDNVPPKLNDPITADDIKQNISKKHPRILLLEGGEQQIHDLIEADETRSTAPTNNYDAENPGTIMVGFECELQANTKETFEGLIL